jgi:hypothetical protein
MELTHFVLLVLCAVGILTLLMYCLCKPNADKLLSELTNEMNTMCKTNTTKKERIERLYQIIKESKASDEEKDKIVLKLQNNMLGECIKKLQPNTN